MIQNITTQKIEDIMRGVAAEYIIPRFRALKEEDVATKTGPQDLVTKADIETEYALIEILEKEFPGAKVMGEEGVSRGDIDEGTFLANPPDILFVVDPVDGTWNFAQGSKVFGSMIALVYKGQTIKSWIYNVMADKFALAELGGGATYAGEMISVSASKPLDQMHGYISHMFANKQMKAYWLEQMQDVATAGAIRCAAHSYMRLARGLVDFQIMTKTKPWDHLAGDLLVREAGGIVKSWDGEPYSLHHFRQGLLVATAEESWDELHEHFIRDVMDRREI